MPQVVIIGASARAAAFSALRAGVTPICFDQFADVDLRAIARVEAVADYPHGLPGRLGELHDLPVVYTGAMENHPEVVAQIAAHQRILGNDSRTIEAVRDPLAVHRALTRVKVPCLEVRAADDPPPADGRWLLKPRRGAAGRGVCVWDEQAAHSATRQEPHYFQQRAAGDIISAVYVAAQEPLQLQYVGLTRQLVGRPELNAPEFRWCGSLGPVALETRGEILARRTGTVLAHQFGLRGLFGCDFIVSPEGEPLLTEVNPRYTASVEILELLCGSTLFEDHCRASGMTLPEGLEARPAQLPMGAIAGKAVLYADRDLLAPDTSSWQQVSPWQPLPGFGDLPHAGAIIRQGGPVCSIFSAASTFSLCEQQLLHSAASVRNVLDQCPSA